MEHQRTSGGLDDFTRSSSRNQHQRRPRAWATIRGAHRCPGRRAATNKSALVKSLPVSPAHVREHFRLLEKRNRRCAIKTNSSTSRAEAHAQSIWWHCAEKPQCRKPQCRMPQYKKSHSAERHSAWFEPLVVIFPEHSRFSHRQYMYLYL